MEGKFKYRITNDKKKWFYHSDIKINTSTLIRGL